MSIINSQSQLSSNYSGFADDVLERAKSFFCLLTFWRKPTIVFGAGLASSSSSSQSYPLS